MNKRYLVIGLAVLFFGLILSLFVLMTPVPNMTNDSEFNVKECEEYLGVISQDQHSVYDTVDHEIVRSYLKAKLSEFIGAGNVTEYNYPGSLTGDNLSYDIHNLLGIIPGQPGNAAIMLVAHYDSRGPAGRAGELGQSYGAADDGYGLATLLEIARLYGGQTLVNPIYILFTDSEEVDLGGAKLAASDTSIDVADKVGFVINVEARGIKGPAIMFETSSENNKVLDFYKNAEYPVAYSLATAVYTVMPNSTDFTKFLKIGKQGINFAVLDNLYYYHTPMDNYSNISLTSLQHYGAQIVPLVDEFTSNAKYADVNYFVDTHNQVFFTLFPNVFISYTDTFAIVLNILVLVAFIGVVGLLIYKKDTSFKKLGLSLAYIFGAIVVVVVLGLFLSKFIAFVGRVPWDLFYVKLNNTGLPVFLILVGMAVGLAYVYKKQAKDRSWQYSIISAGVFLNLLLALVTGFVLSGASFLFMIPALFGLIALAIIKFNKNIWVKQVVLGLIMILSLLVIVPLLYLLFLAITVGGLLVFGVIMLFYLVTLVPCFFWQIETPSLQ